MTIYTASISYYSDGNEYTEDISCDNRERLNLAVANLVLRKLSEGLERIDIEIYSDCQKYC